VSALIASLFAVGAAPAGAAEINDKSTQSNLSGATACLGSARDDHGFTDLSSLEGQVSNINCLAYYGISAGKPDGTFDPDSNVTRSQMALFLYAAADKAGIDLMGGDMMADFGDISELGENRQAAITALAKNGILAGRGDMAFEPYADITRAEMAVALVNLVDKVSDEVKKNATSGLFELNDGNDVYEAPAEYFADARRTVPAHVDNAISAAYELGISKGYPDGTFRPNDSVPRRNMASFIISALAHSSLRPAGVTAQVVGDELVASVRDSNFAPVVNQAVDAVSISSAIASKAFKADGSCSSRITPAACVIGVADPVTLSDGDAMLAMPTITDAGVTVWVWAGAIDDKFGADTDAFELELTKEAAALPDPSAVEVSSDQAEGSTVAHFGSTVTITLQLQGDPDEADNTNPFVNVPPKTRTTINLVTSYYWGTAVSGTPFDVDTETLVFGDDGAVSFTLTAPDPDPSAGNTVFTHPSRTAATGEGDNNVTGGYALSGLPTGITLASGDEAGSVTFTDQAPAAANAKVEGAAKFAQAPASGSASNAAIVSVTDQFGRPVARASVTVTGGNDATFPTTARITGRSGQVRIDYTYSGDAGTQTLSATVGTLSAVTANVIWYDRAGVDDKNETTAQTVLNIDPVAGEIIVTDGTTTEAGEL